MLRTMVALAATVAMAAAGAGCANDQAPPAAASALVSASARSTARSAAQSTAQSSAAGPGAAPTRAATGAAATAASPAASPSTPLTALPPGTAPTVDDPTIYRGVATVIQVDGQAPMIAFAIRESMPPQGGDIVVGNFSWDDLEGEQTASGTTWLDSVELVGRRTADGFELTEPAAPGTPTLSPLTFNQPTAGCDPAVTGPMITKLGVIDHQAMGIIGEGEYAFDGHCGVVLTVLFDTPELRAAVAEVLGADADVSYEPQFRPADAPPTTVPLGSIVGSD